MTKSNRPRGPQDAASGADRPDAESSGFPNDGANDPHGAAQPGDAGTDPQTAAPQAQQGQAAPADGSQADRDTQPAGQPNEPTEREKQLSAQLIERTADVQRVQAEYVNYKKRVDRDDALKREVAKANVVSEFLGVFDDIERARDHGELEGGFRIVSQQLEKVATKLGLKGFAEVGEPFDPVIHEALVSQPNPDVTAPTIIMVMERGYRLGERVLRVARVGVAIPADPSAASATPAENETSAAPTDGETAAPQTEGESATPGPEGAADSSQ